MPPTGASDSEAKYRPVPDRLHPIPIGETIAVLRFAAHLPPFIEGCAVVKGAAREPHRYLVQFIGDPVLRLRIVHPDYQTDPERWLRILRDLGRADAGACQDVADFFPEERL